MAPVPKVKRAATSLEGNFNGADCCPLVEHGQRHAWPCGTALMVTHWMSEW